MRLDGRQALWLLHGHGALGSVNSHSGFIADRQSEFAPRYCPSACQRLLSSLSFADQSQPGDSPVCGSHLRGVSYLGCVRQYCENGSHAVRAAVKELNSTCTEGGGHGLVNWEDVRGETGWMVVKQGESEGQLWEEEVLLDESWVRRMARTLDAWDYASSRHISYSWAMSCYWLVLITLSLLSRLVPLLPSPAVRSYHTQAQGSRLAVWWRKHFGLPLTFGSAVGRDCRLGTVPPRGQGLAIAVFLLMNLCAACVGYRIFPDNLFYADITSQYLRYVSDRTGILSLANFPLLWLFGTRNNLVSLLTGWDFPACTQFHRWIGRVAVAEGVVHSLGYTWLVVREGGWQQFWHWWTFTFWWTGELATVLLCALVALSIFYIRARHYEIFLLTHILLSILSLPLLLLHVSIFPGVYQPLVYVPLAIWLLDRLLRALRTIAFHPKFWAPNARAEYSPEANMIRLEVATGDSWYRMPEGAYCYLTLLHGSRFYESHPFTVAGLWPGSATGKEHPEHGLLLAAENFSAFTDGGRGASDSHATATFLIRPYASFTARLRDLCLSSPGTSSPPLRVLVDGPYGASRPLDAFTDLVFIACGSGIAIPLSYLTLLLRPSSRAARVEIHWAVREAGFAREVLQRDLARVAGDERFAVYVYTPSHLAAENVGRPEGLVVQHKRLDAGEILRGTGAGGDKGRTAVVSCGPGGMADDVRDALRGCAGAVTYFEETYTW